MEKEFIPYKQALALKELGFDEPCFGWFRSTLIPSNFTEYFLETEFGLNESPSDWVNSNFLGKACSAPLYQQAFRWFREKHSIQLGICHIHGGFDCWTNDGDLFENGKYCNFKTYEEAELECLKKLIELCKK
jgi:hypothetical protein